MVNLNLLTRMSLFALSTNGVDPRQTSKFSFIYKWIALACNFAIVFLSGIELLLDFRGIETVERADQLPNSCLNFSKFICIVYFRREILDVLSCIDKFWELNKHGEFYKKKLSTYEIFATRFYKIYITLCLFTVTVLSFKPYILRQRILAFPGYEFCNLQTTPCFELYSGFQIYHIMTQLYPVIMGFDGLFITFLTYVFIEIQQIKFGLKIVMMKISNNEKLAKKELKILIEHHNFILSVIKKLKNIYAPVLFVKYWTSMGSMIFSLYMLTRNGIPPPTSLLLKYGQYFFNLAVQFGLYCLGGNILMDQVVSVADAAFESEWYLKKDKTLRQAIPLIIQRSHRGEKIRIGKMTDLNLETYMNLLRHVVSIYTLLDKLTDATLQR